MVQKNKSNTLQAAWVAMGSMSSFLFSILSAAILSRFLVKSDYGTYKQVMYVYNTLLVVFTLGLPKAYGYFLPRVRKEEGSHVVNKLNLCFFLLGAAFTLILFFGAPLIAKILSNPELESLIRIFSPAPLFLLPTMGIEGIMATYSISHFNAIYQICTRIFMLMCVAMPVMFYKATSEVAVWGFTVSSMLSFVIALYIKKIPFKGVESLKSNISYKDIFSFSLPLMVSALWAILIKSADQFFVSRWYGEETFADFSNGSLELPFVHMILSAGGVVLLPVFSKFIKNGDNKNEIVSLWMRVTEKATFVIYPMVIYCWFFAPLIMTFLYGDAYLVSSNYFRIMLVANLFTIAQYYPIILALGATKYYASVHMYTAILVWILEYLSVITIGSPYAITTVSVVCHILKIYLMVKYISDYLRIKPYELFPLKRLFFTLCSCSLSGIIALGICNYTLPNIEKLIVIIISMLIYVPLVLLSGKLLNINYFEVVKPIFKKIKK